MPLASQIELPERYRVARHIASGGMASVWEAEDLMLGRVVAVKVLGAQFASDPGARARFQREARTAAQVSDQSHVVTIYDIGEHGDDAFIVMEYFAGGTVADRLRAARQSGDRIPRETALRWLGEAAAGLDVAHVAGIVHRDVKPANLLLDAQDRLAVADFGIARLADDTQMTQTGQVLGTAAYISPEQAVGQPAGPASDRYALAVVAYELLTGERPFSGGPPTAQALAHAQAQPPRASQASPDLPPAVDEILARGLAKDPAQRPATASELVESITSVLSAGATTEPTRPIAAVAPTKPTERQHPTPPRAVPLAATPPRPAPAPLSAPQAPPPRGQDPTPPARRRPWPALLAAAVLAGAVLALVLALAGGDDPRRSAQQLKTTTTSADQPRTTARTPAAEPAPREPEPEAPASDTSGDPAALNDEGHRLIQAGSHGAAVAPLQASVKGYRDAEQTDDLNYAFALFNLGVALNRSGNPEAAIPVLQERLKIKNQTEAVQAELDDARARLEANDNDGNDGDGQGNNKQDRDKQDREKQDRDG
ncbi:MAG: serine/threonine-protein kinase [Solirubrobacteraceae bacterium]